MLNNPIYGGGYMIWKTAITKVEPNHIVTRGYRQEDL
ncbi:MAG TPA: citryl-CoA lyase, partial [bacterium (Candidatus Stahlbacteria)]|nr:citryl-CoA lyase [Candidatus Stahlbacteria bacterium]